MHVEKASLGFGARSLRYAAVTGGGVIEVWLKKPGRADNHPDDPYGESAPETVLDWLRGSKAVATAAE